MTGLRKINPQRSLKVLALFAVAFALQGASLVVFHGDRANNRTHPKHAYPWSSIQALNVYTVTTVEDGGPGSLRQAILDANENPGPDGIVFDFNDPITLTVFSPFHVTDGVRIDASRPATGGHISDTGIPNLVTIDGSNVQGSLFVVTGTVGTDIRGLRITNVNSGYGFLLSKDVLGTVVISNTVENGYGGVQIQGSQQITVTRNTLIGLKDAALVAVDSDDLWLTENVIRNIGLTGIQLMGGVQHAWVMTNTINSVESSVGAGIAAYGLPAPTGIVMLDNHFTDPGASPIFLGPGANFDFPAPEILGASLTYTGTLQLDLASSAHPVTYTYPVSIDLYRVRDGSYSPLGVGATYRESDYPNPISMTTFVGDLIDTDYIAAIATTFNPNTSEFSTPVALTPPPPVDSDGDGVVDDDDVCPGTAIPESTVPSDYLGVNRFALVDGDLIFDTVVPEGEGPARTYTTTETGGCSCEQIIDELGLGGGHKKFGCSISQMDRWVAQVGAAAKEAAADASHSEAAPETFVLEQNYPNPFNPATTITFELPEQRRVVLRVFDVMGRVVTTLVDTELDQGTHQVTWNGRNAQGQSVASGLYIYRIEAGDFSTERTMSLLR